MGGLLLEKGEEGGGFCPWFCVVVLGVEDVDRGQTVGVIKKVGWAGFMIGLGLLLDQTFGLFGLDLLFGFGL